MYEHSLQILFIELNMIELNLSAGDPSNETSALWKTEPFRVTVPVCEVLADVMVLFAWSIARLHA